MLKNSLLPRLLKKVRMSFDSAQDREPVERQGGARGGARGALSAYVAAPRDRANAADGPVSADCEEPLRNNRLTFVFRDGSLCRFQNISWQRNSLTAA
jgi:hypothetical protein